MPNTPVNVTKDSRGYLFALASSVFLSTTAIFIRHLTLTYQLPELVLALWRNVFVVLTLLIALGIIRPGLLKVDQKHYRYLLFYGLALASFNAFWTLSVAANGAAVATVLVYCSTAFTVLLGFWLLREQLTAIKLIAVVVCLGGCVLVAGVQTASLAQGSLIGALFGVLSGLFYAVFTLMGRSAAQRGLNPWTSLIYTFGIAGLFLLLVNLLPGKFLPGQAASPAEIFWLGSRWAGWGVLLLLAAVPTVAGFGFYNVSLSHLPSSIVNLVVTTEPPFTALFAFLIFGERLNGIQAAGSLLILGGVIFLRVFEGRAERKAQNRQKRENFHGQEESGEIL